MLAALRRWHQVIGETIFESVIKTKLTHSKIYSMKKMFFIVFAIIFLAGTISIPARGQVAVTKVQPSNGAVSYARSVTKDVSSPAYRNSINVRAVRHFLLNFDNVSGEEWYDAPNMFAVMFSLNNIDYRVDYDKKGNWIETFRTYDENKLARDLEDIVKSSYPDYKILVVQEIENPLNTLTYIIHLEGKTKLINLRIFKGEVEEWQNFNKSK